MTPPIDAALVRALIAAQFPGWASLAVRPVPVDGWDNRTFRLGEELAVRLPSGPGYDLQVRKESTWLPHIQAGVGLPIPEVVAVGHPGSGYPFEWSVRRWITGTPLRDTDDADPSVLAGDLAGFLVELRAVPAADGPEPGEHSQHRGGPLAHWREDVEHAIDRLGERIDADRASGLWRDALGADEQQAPRWLHGDVAAGNLLMDHGRLSAVIDFGCAAVGDPACDLVPAWTILDPRSRARFRSAMGVTEAEWHRGAGWALWKALITVDDPREGGTARQALRELQVLG